MPNLPVRNLGQFGLVRDVEPWDDPWEAWSGGRNIRFENNKALRGPILRTVIDATGTPLANAVQAVGYRTYNGADYTFLLDTNGRAVQATPGLPQTDVSGSTAPTTVTTNVAAPTGTPNDPSGPVTTINPFGVATTVTVTTTNTKTTVVTPPAFTPISSTTQFTSCVLGNVFYLNRDTHPLRYWLPSSTALAPVPYLDVPFTAGIVRALQSCLVCFNITKQATNYGTLVKWSDAAQAGNVPGTWDPTSTTNLAGENTLTDASGPIMDAQNLRSGIVIYTTNQIYLMAPTGNETFPFSFQKLWQDDRWGAISRNCSVEVNGLHYVFGNGDIYVHDGVSPPVSLAEGKIRRYVFQNMNMAYRNAFFVAHDPYLSTVMFCYVSTDPDVQFPAAGLCNKAATWNYQSNTWGTMELPNIGGGCWANTNTVVTWASEPSTASWASLKRSWSDLINGYKPALVLAGSAAGTALPRNTLYAVDPLYQNARLSLPADPYGNSSAYVEHAGVDLDRAGLPLQNFKRIRKVNPLVRVYNAQPITVSLGAAAETPGLPNYAAPVPLDPSDTYRVDSRASGRFMALRIDAPALCDFDVTGFDVDVIGGGKR